jgi:hypothetical protein
VDSRWLSYYYRCLLLPWESQNVHRHCRNVLFSCLGKIQDIWCTELNFARTPGQRSLKLVELGLFNTNQDKRNPQLMNTWHNTLEYRKPTSYEWHSTYDIKTNVCAFWVCRGLRVLCFLRQTSNLPLLYNFGAAVDQARKVATHAVTVHRVKEYNQHSDQYSVCVCLNTRTCAGDRDGMATHA